MTLQINTSTGARDLTTDEQAEARAGLAAAAAADLSAHATSTSNPHSVTKAQVGLGNADNTSDADKPVSTAQAAAIAAAVTAHIDAVDPHPGKYAPTDHTHTPASIGAATTAQGATADTALQPGAQLTQAAVAAATVPGVALLGAATAADQRAELGLGTAATTAASDYATAAQGAKADAALPANADAIADVLEAAATGAPADLARIKASVSGDRAKLTTEQITQQAAGATTALLNSAKTALKDPAGGADVPLGASFANLIVNGNFDDTSGWTLDAGFAITGGVLVSSSNSSKNAVNTAAVVAGGVYIIFWKQAGSSSNVVRINIKSPGDNIISEYYNGTGSYAHAFVAPVSGNIALFNYGNGATFDQVALIRLL